MTYLLAILRRVIPNVVPDTCWCSVYERQTFCDGKWQQHLHFEQEQGEDHAASAAGWSLGVGS